MYHFNTTEVGNKGKICCYFIIVYFIIYYFMFLIWQILYPIGLLDLVWIDRKQIKNEWMNEWMTQTIDNMLYLN
jgi:hypothetical protein